MRSGVYMVCVVCLFVCVYIAQFRHIAKFDRLSFHLEIYAPPNFIAILNYVRSRIGMLSTVTTEKTIHNVLNSNKHEGEISQK